MVTTGDRDTGVGGRWLGLVIVHYQFSSWLGRLIFRAGRAMPVRQLPCRCFELSGVRVFRATLGHTAGAAAAIVDLGYGSLEFARLWSTAQMRVYFVQAEWRRALLRSEIAHKSVLGE
jgi:hypothetical protein